MTDEPALELRGVRKVFPGQGRQQAVCALDGLDLTVARGEFLAIVGASGGGKSTLIDLIAGFIRPTAGSILADGRPIRAPGPDRVVVFQDHAVFPWYTALGNVAYGLRRQGLGRREAKRRAADALRHVGLGKFLHAHPVSLSGGMRQRVALARALVLQPRILLLDEPFAALDAVTRARLQDELTALWHEYGWTVVFVTHNLAEAVYLADRVALLDSPPDGICGMHPIDVERPRDRRDSRLIDMTRQIGARLADQDEQADAETCLCVRLDESTEPPAAGEMPPKKGTP